MRTPQNPGMDFETADRIVDRLGEVLQEEHRVGSFFALEQIGS